VLLVLGASLLSLFGAMIEEAEEASITRGVRVVVRLLIFSGANVVAAGLAALPGRRVTLRAVAALSLIPPSCP